MKRITILALHLGFGGIEKCISSFANSMCDKFDITIVSTYKLYDKPSYELDSRIKIVYLIEDDLALRVDKYKKAINEHHYGNLIKILFNDYIKKLHLIRLIKDTFNSKKILNQKKKKMVDYLISMDTDIVISTRDSINSLVSQYVKKPYKIAWEHNYGDMSYIHNVCDSCVNFNKIVLVSTSLRDIYKSVMLEKKYKCECVMIPNVIDEVPNTVSKLNNNRLVAVGRLSKEKGYLDLVDVIELVYKKNQNITLDLIGDGDQKEEIIEKIKSRNLTNIIKLHGFQDKSYINNILENSTLFLMSSFTESFGIVLIEAMAYGIPCIAFDSAEGANDIIINDKNGYLVMNRDTRAMASMIVDLLNDREKIIEFGNKARETSLKYTKDKVYQKWLEIL